MKIFSDSEARERLSEVLDRVRKEEVIIQRSDGESFSVNLKKSSKSPFDVDGIDTRATTGDILEAIKESRSGGDIGFCRILAGLDSMACACFGPPFW